MKCRYREYLLKIFTVLLWLLLWQLLAVKIDRSLFLPSPASVWNALMRLLVSWEFYLSIGRSFQNIGKGFLLAGMAGALLSVLSAKLACAAVFLELPMRMIQAAPVASFTILALFWLGAEELSVLVAFLMVLPIFYTNLLAGIRAVDASLSEMAQVYHVRWRERLFCIYLPQILPHAFAACSLAAGLAWKSGIAAEVIGMVGNTVGNQLYQAKLYMEMPELFAWTLVIIAVSSLFGYACKTLIRLTERVVSKQRRLPLCRRRTLPLQPHKPVRLLEVSKSFGDIKICDKLSLTLLPGEHVALMGRSGAGKTTIARLLLGLEKPDAGRTVTEGQRIAAVFQEERLCEEISVRRNLELVCESEEQAGQIEPVLSALGLSGLEEKKVSLLSGGMKRRIAIARSFVADSPVLVFDEPLKGLDEVTKSEVMAFMKEQMKKKTVLYITHDKKEAEYFDCAVLMPGEGRSGEVTWQFL